MRDRRIATGMAVAITCPRALPFQDPSSLAFFHLLPLILLRFSQLPQGTVLASWIKMADSTGEEEENELGASRKDRGEGRERKIKGERDFVAWTTEAKAGIIDESFRNLDFEAGSPLNGMNTGREPSYAGLSAERCYPLARGNKFSRYRLSPCVA